MCFHNDLKHHSHKVSHLFATILYIIAKLWSQLLANANAPHFSKNMTKYRCLGRRENIWTHYIFNVKGNETLYETCAGTISKNTTS